MWACQDIAKAKQVIFLRKNYLTSKSRNSGAVICQKYEIWGWSTIHLLGGKVTDCKHLIVISGDEIIVPNCSMFNLKCMQITGSQTWPNIFHTVPKSYWKNYSSKCYPEIFCHAWWLKLEYWTYPESFETIILSDSSIFGFPSGSAVKSPPARQEMWVWSLDWEYPPKKEVAIYSNILAWRIPWTEELGVLQSMGYKESDMISRLSMHTHMLLNRNDMVILGPSKD